MNHVKGKLYDGDGQEIVIPENHYVVLAKDRFAFVPFSEETQVTWIYKEPNKNDPKYLKALEICNYE